LEIIRATMVTGTTRAARAAIALAEADQVCERMPPASTMADPQVTTTIAITVSGWLVSQVAA
jgi:hypothetical protein